MYPNLVTVLSDLGDSGLRLSQAIPLVVRHSQSMEAWVVTEDTFGWHGVGNTVVEATKDLAESIVEDYRLLSEWHGQLAPHLSDRLAAYRKYVIDAGED